MNPKTLRILSLLIFFLNVLIISAQDDNQHQTITSALKQIRLLDFDPIRNSEGKLEDKDIGKQILNYNSILSEFGFFEVTTLIEKPSEKNVAGSSLALNKLNLGLYDLLYEYDNEDQSLSYLNDALKISQESRNRLITCEIIKAILVYHDRLLIVKDYPKYYLDLYSENAYDATEKQIFKLLKADMGFVGDEFIHDKSVILEILEMAPNISSRYYKALAYKILGKYYDIAESDYQKALVYHNRALEIISGRNEGMYRTLEEKIEINIAIIEFLQKKFSDTLKRLEAIENEYPGKTNNYLDNFKYIWISNSQNELGLQKKAYYSLDKSRVIRNKLNQTYHASKVTKYRMDLETDQKDIEIDELSKEKSGLKRNLFTLIPILGIISIILVIIFFLYKKYYKKTTVLEEEKSETLQKLDELKNIVIKNHIILKDKTKVYISDLMYIKSDDHYLNVYTSDDKNHFVRGKLSLIKQELPPNFIQCHRSYIVNSNFIKRINNESITLVDKTNVPLSRSYKKKF